MKWILPIFMAMENCVKKITPISLNPLVIFSVSKIILHPFFCVSCQNDIDNFIKSLLALCKLYKQRFVAVTSQHGTAALSPYLNFDPSYLPTSQPEFIFPEGAVKQRGRFELAFSQIGAACILGAGFGGAAGFYRGLKATTLAGQTGKLRRTQ